MAKSLYMVIELFKGGDAAPVYRRFRDRGRLAPEGLSYICSWVDMKLERCYQLMEADDPALFDAQAAQLLSEVRTIAAFAYRKSRGLPINYPKPSLKYTENFLHMMFSLPHQEYVPPPEVLRALDLIFVLHADHEQNCSTSTVRMIASSRANLFASVAGGVCALWGPLHGGANQAVIEMLERIRDDGGDYKKYITMAKDKSSGFRLMGFGHRVYKNFDPRAEIIKKHVDEVFEVTGKNPKLDIAVELEKRALDDDYFSERKLYPNVDFYSGLIYEALNLPPDMFTVMFAIPRTSGWVAQWLEMVQDPETKIARPRQIYTGAREQSYVPIEKREKRSEKPVAPTNLIDPARSKR